jgi:hypothetical protein
MVDQGWQPSTKFLKSRLKAECSQLKDSRSSESTSRKCTTSLKNERKITQVKPTQGKQTEVNQTQADPEPHLIADPVPDPLPEPKTRSRSCSGFRKGKKPPRTNSYFLQVDSRIRRMIIL